MHSSSRDTPMSLPDNGSITVAQLMDHPGQTYLCRRRQFFGVQSDSEPNHAIFVTCATRLAAMRYNESGCRAALVHLTEGNQDHKLAGRVASDFGPPGRISLVYIFPNPTVAQPLSAQLSKESAFGSPRCGIQSKADEYRIPLSDNVFRSPETPGASEARRVGDFAERRRGMPIVGERAQPSGAAATSSCARKVNRHNGNTRSA